MMTVTMMMIQFIYEREEKSRENKGKFLFFDGEEGRLIGVYIILIMFKGH